MKRKTFFQGTIKISFFLILLFFSSQISAQTTISGQVLDENREPLIGVNIISSVSALGTTTDNDGRFNLTVDTSGSFNLIFSYIGYENKVVKIDLSTSNLEIIMSFGVELGEVVVTGPSKKKERWIAAPITVEIMSLSDIRQSSAPDPYDDIANMKGVQTFNSSLNFPSYNFRGFGAIANERFVQLVDGMDNAAPLLKLSNWKHRRDFQPGYA